MKTKRRQNRIRTPYQKLTTTRKPIQNVGKNGCLQLLYDIIMYNAIHFLLDVTLHVRYTSSPIGEEAAAVHF